MIWMDRTSWPVLRRVDYDYHDPSLDWYQAAKNSNVPHITEPYFDPGGSELTMVRITYPVTLDGEFLGVAGVETPLSEIQDLMTSIHNRAAERRTGMGSSGYIYLASAAGRLMVYPDATLTVGADRPGAMLSSLPEGQLIGARSSGMTKYHGPQGDRIVHWVVAPSTHWKVVLDQSSEIVMMPIRKLEVNTVAIAGGGLAVLLCLVGVIASRATRPIVKLERSAKALERANFDPSELDSMVRRRDESGRLARAFQSMAREIRSREESLAEWNRNLESTVTERTRDLVKAREAAEEASRTKSSFLANMSHELRTPMNAIIGYSEMLLEEAEDLEQEGFIPDLKKIHGAGKHLLGLINDMLDLSKIEAGKMTVYLEDFDISAMVGEVAATIQPLVAKNGNELVVNSPASLGKMRADITKVRQTLFNLLSNAAKFTNNGKVTLAVSIEDRAGAPQVFFRGADTGIGMTAEQMGKLFQAFVQADASTTRKFGGTGLGLAISRRFCQMMGGDITVTSEMGKGTVFTAVVPVRAVDETAGAKTASAKMSPAAPAPLAESISGDAPLILIVDDDPAVVDLLSRNLTRDGYRVRSVMDGREAVRLAKELQPRVITLDVMMPSMDGWSVLTALKADSATHDIPVVMVTIVDDRQIGFALGAADYITKPVDRDRLSAVLARYAKADAARLALVVDDLTDNRDLLRRALEGQGWSVVEAENGKEGLKRVDERIPGLILLDLMMPVMDGFEFLRELRARPGGRDVPVVVVTAKELSNDERAWLRNGVENIVQNNGTKAEELLTDLLSKIAAVSKK
jgi:signal transduction histidine kinase/CheY-like chemotaxis protein